MVFDALDEVIRIIRKSDGKADAAAKLIDALRARRGADRRDPRAEALQAGPARDPGRSTKELQGEARRGRGDRGAAQGPSEALGRWCSDELGEMAEQVRRQAAHQDRRRRATRSEFSPRSFIVDEDATVIVTRDGWVKRVRESRIRVDHAPARGRRGAGRARRLDQEQPGASSRTSARPTSPRINDVPASTGYGEPVQKLFKFDDGERVVGALSLDPRLPPPGEADRRSSQARLRPALRARAAHASCRPAPGAGSRRPAEGDETVGVVPVGEQGSRWRWSPSTRARSSARRARSTSSPAPGSGVTVIKVGADDRVVGLPLHREEGRSAGAGDRRRARS